MAEVKMNMEIHEVHTKKEDSIFHVALNLALVCVISGLIMAATYYITAPVAAKKSELLKQQAMQTLVPDAEQFEAIPDKADWFVAKKAGQNMAYVVPSSTKGYGGEIKLLVAVATDKTVLDFKILSANETPGLGDNASKPAFRSQFAGKKAEALTVVKDKSNQENIQAMTGATISSTAVTNGVKAAVEEVNAYMGGK